MACRRARECEAKGCTVDVHLTATQKTALRNALKTLETLVGSAKYQTLLGYWGQMDDATRRQIMKRAPLLERLMTLAARLPRTD